jgi:hypothetical protein
MDGFFTTQLDPIQLNSHWYHHHSSSNCNKKSSWGWVVEREALSEALNVVTWREIISLGSHTREYLQKFATK